MFSKLGRCVLTLRSWWSICPRSSHQQSQKFWNHAYHQQLNGSFWSNHWILRSIPDEWYLKWLTKRRETPFWAEVWGGRLFSKITQYGFHMNHVRCCSSWPLKENNLIFNLLTGWSKISKGKKANLLQTFFKTGKKSLSGQIWAKSWILKFEDHLQDLESIA
jgi:hypothetical protein